MSDGTKANILFGRIKDEFLTERLGVDSFKIVDVKNFKWEKSSEDKNNKMTFEYVRLDQDHFNLIDKYIRLGFYSVCQEISMRLVGEPESNTLTNGIKTGCATSHDGFTIISNAKEIEPINLDEFAVCFTHDRFIMDQHTRSRSFGLKRAWIKNVFERRHADNLLVAINPKGFGIGFLSFVNNKNTNVIDLIATLPDYRGKGVATALLKCIQSPIEALTQFGNKEAVAFYTKNGFKLKKLYTVLHRFQ